MLTMIMPAILDHLGMQLFQVEAHYFFTKLIDRIDSICKTILPSFQRARQVCKTRDIAGRK